MAREYWSADCETDPFKFGRMPEPFIWGAYNGEDYYEFSSASEFVSFFINKKVVVYAHNGGKFDWHYILDWLEPGTKIQVINGRLAKFKIGEAEFRDSYNLFPFPLSEYKKDIVDYAIFEKEKRDDPTNRDTIRRYLKSDCSHLYDLLDEFFDKYGRKLTLPGAALNQWRLISDEEPDNSSQNFYEQFSPYYYGGRVECFVKGFKKEKFNVYDINSAYPYAMCHKHPWGLVSFVDNRLPKSDDKISRCFIKLETLGTGAFPSRCANSGLGFPSDNKPAIFHITGWEYLAARDTDSLDARTKILSVTEFADSIDFKTYVEHFYNLKAEAKKAGLRGQELFAKYLLNGLYGKFASNPDNYSEYMTCLPDEVAALGTDELGGWKFVTELQNVAIVSRPLPAEGRRYFNVAVGASITGFVRAHLWRALQSGGHPLYCDTDSIAIAGSAKLPQSNKLGDWKDEGAFKSYAIAGKKLYAFEYEKPVQKDGEEIKYKIASKGAKLTAKEINQLAKGEKIEYNQDAPTFGLRGKRFNTRNMRMT